MNGSEARVSLRVPVSGWRRWAGDYVAGLMLAVSIVAAPPAGHLRTRPALVRVVGRRRSGRFDDRELTAEAVLTLPLPPRGTAAGSRGAEAPDLN